MGKYPICHHITEGCIIPCVFSILTLYLHFYILLFGSMALKQEVVERKTAGFLIRHSGDHM